MGLFSKLRRSAKGDAQGLDQQPGDAVCLVRIEDQANKRHKLGIPEMRQLVHHWGRRSEKGEASSETPSAEPQETPDTAYTCHLALTDLPPGPAFIIWTQLPADSKRALRLSAADWCRDSVTSLCLTGQDLKRCEFEQLSTLGSRFPGLNELQLHLAGHEGTSDCSKLADSLRKLKGSAGKLPHLHSFSIDCKLRGEAWHVLARFLVLCPNLKQLSLLNQRLSTPGDQRILAAVLEALPGLTHLDLGSSIASSSSGSSSSSPSVSNAVSSGVLRRITRLRNLRSLSCNLTAVADLEALSELAGLQSLSISAAGEAAALVAALQRLHCLTSLELEHPRISCELEGCIKQMSRLRVLALGLCPRLKDTIMGEVAQLQQLEKLTLPFPITSTHLQLLSKLRHLSELFSWRHVALDVLGPAHEPLTQITRLVASSIHGHGKPLGAWFPALETVCLKRCNDVAALSLRGTNLQVLLAGDCSQLTNEGFACLKGLKSLHKLHMDSASQVSDSAFAAVFSSTMPALHSLSFNGAHNLSDHGLQLLTASCRRLSSISIGSCRLLTDKTLKRLAHCEHLTHVTLRSCAAFTADGVAALAAAPQMKSVVVNSCSEVKSSLCRGHRSGVKVRVE